MKLRKILLALVLLLTLTFGLVSCGDKGGQGTEEPPVVEPEKFEPVAIETIAKTYTNNQAVQAEGIVYGVTSNGFYLSDSANGHLFVVIGDNFKKDVAVGDKVQVTGKFSYSQNLIQINRAEYKKVGTGTALVAATESTIPAVNALANTDKTVYGKVVTLTGTLSLHATNMYALTDLEGNTIFFDNYSNLEALAQYNNKRVVLNAVVYKYLASDAVWTLSFVGGTNEIVESPLTFEIVKEKALEHLNAVVAKNVYGALDLPTVHNILSNITYSWAVDANDYLTIENNEAIVVIDSADHEVTLKVTINYGETSETVDFPVTLKAIVEQTVAEFYANKPMVDDSVVIVRGVIVSLARNQSLSTRSIILRDPVTNETLPVDFAGSGDYILNTSEEFKSLKVGDEVVVTAEYSFNGRPTVQCVSKIEKRSSGNAVTHDFENAYVLDSKESYMNLAANVYEYSGQLVKFANPFLNYSTSGVPADTNWVQLGYDTKSGAEGFKVEGTARKFAFLIAAVNENLGSDTWHKNYDIPFISGPAAQFNLEIYAYCLYVSDSYVAFIVPDETAFGVAPADKIIMDLESGIPSSVEMENVTLPQQHEFVTGAITWTSSHPAVIDPTTGVVSEVSENTVVTLTATYVFEGQTLEFTKNVTVLASQSISVSELLATAQDGFKYKVNGVVVGFSSDGNTHEYRKGVILMDPATGELVLVDGLGTLYSVTYPNYVDENGAAITIGTMITVTGSYAVDTAEIGTGPLQTGRKHLDVSAGKVIAGEKVEYSFNDETAILIDSNDAQTASVAEGIPFGKLIKFVGTAENPIYFGGSSNTAPINYKVFMNNAVDNNGTKYNGKTFSFKGDNNEANAGEAWYSKYLALPEAFVCPNATNAPRAVVGTVYAVITHVTSTYYQMAIVNIENWDVQPEVKYVQELVVDKLPTSVDAGELKLNLLENTYLTGAITWESSNAIINLTNKTVATVSENTEVTLTATFTYAGETVTVDHVITVLAPAEAEPLTITELTASSTDLVAIRAKGVVIGFSSDGNSKEERKGLIVMDNATGKTVLLNNIEGATYPTYTDVNGIVIKVGDELIIEGDYFVSTDAIDSKAPYQTNRHNIKVSKMTVVNSGVEINYHLENAIVIDSHSAAEALFADLEKIPYGQIIKIVGTTENPFYIGGSSSDASKVNFKVYFSNATDNDGTKYNDKTLSLKGVVNNAITGSETWYTDLFGIPGAFVGPKEGATVYSFTGTIYLVITHTTGSYYQANLVNYAECNATLIA